jgi:uncharacterized membrane protein
MLLATFKTIHLLSIVVWVGGMFFTLYCLRPALAVLEAPALRMRLMHAVLKRFFRFVLIAALLTLLSGVGMIGMAAQSASQAGLRFNMPIDWHLMSALGTVMVLIFAHIRFRLFGRFGQAVAKAAWPEAGAALNRIRAEVSVNLGLGVLIIVATQWGALA